MKPFHLLFIAVISLLTAGCSGGGKKDGGKEQANSPSETNNTKSPGDNTPANNETDSDKDKKAQDQVRKVMGDIDLREWPTLTQASIGDKLKPEVVQKIIGVDHPLKAEKSEFSPNWKYSWQSPDKKQRGSITVGIGLESTPSQMMIQAKVRIDGAKNGKAEEVDLKKYGVVGVVRIQRKSCDLQICTKKKILIINTGNMRGRDFTDDDAKKKAAAEIAIALFDSLTS